MKPNDAASLVQRFQLFSQAAAVTVIAVALLVLVGWLFDLEALTKILPAWASMKANTAIAFLFSGSSLLLQQDPSRPSPRRLGKLCAVVALTIGALTLGEYLFGWNLGLGEAFFKEQGAVGSLYPGRMAPMTALIFSLSGVALLLLDGRFAAVFQALALMFLFPSAAAALGYFFGTQSLYKVGPYVSMAFHTAISFLILGLGILFARPAGGLVARASADDLGGVLLRRLFPRMVLLVGVLGWVRWMGQRAEYYDTAFGLAIMILSSILVLGILVWKSAGALSRVDRQRSEARQALISLNLELEQRVEQRGVQLQVVVHAREETIAELQQMQAASLNLMEDFSQEVTERKRIEEEVERKNRDLETLLHVTSHDLKEPLRAIENFSQMVSLQYASRLDEKGQDFLRRCVHAAERMRFLLEDILSLSRSRKIIPPTEFIQSRQVVEEALDRLKVLVDKTGAKVRIVGELPPLQIDRVWANQALYNLIANALSLRGPASRPRWRSGPMSPRAMTRKKRGLW